MSVIKLFIAAVLLTLSNMFCLHLVQSLLIFRLDSFPKHLRGQGVPSVQIMENKFECLADRR